MGRGTGTLLSSSAGGEPRAGCLQWDEFVSVYALAVGRVGSRGSLIVSGGQWKGDDTVPVPRMSCPGHTRGPSDVRAASEQMGHPQHDAWGRGVMEDPPPRPVEGKSRMRQGGDQPCWTNSPAGV